MAITKKDLVELQETLTHNLTQSLSQMWRSDLRVALAQQRDDIKHDIRDEMDAKFLASDKRMSQKLDNLRIEFKVKHDMHTIHKDLKHDIANIHLHVGMAT